MSQPSSIEFGSAGEMAGMYIAPPPPRPSAVHSGCPPARGPEIKSRPIWPPARPAGISKMPIQSQHTGWHDPREIIYLAPDARDGPLPSSPPMIKEPMTAYCKWSLISSLGLFSQEIGGLQARMDGPRRSGG